MIGRPRLALLLWLLGLVLSVGVIARTSFTTDMSAFLPSAPEPAQQILVDQVKDGVASRLILVGIDGTTPAMRAVLSRAIGTALRAQDEFALVENGTDDIGKADQAYVWNNRYLLNPDIVPDRFSVAGLRRAFEQDVELLTSDMSPLIKTGLTHDPTGETLGLVSAMTGASHRLVRDGVWVSADGRRALILAQTRAPGVDIDAQERAMTAIRQAFAQAAKEAAGDDTVGTDTSARLLLTGPGVFGVKTRAEMKHDVTLYSTVATGAIIALLLAVYRSALALGLTLVPVVTGALAGIAAVSLWFGFVHGITIGFGVTLIGESVDYAIYLLAQTGPHSSPAMTLARIWPTLRLGVLVSICGFAAMLLSSFTGFAQLGIFTIVGLATAVTVTRFVLPVLLPAGYAGTRQAVFAPRLLRLAVGASRLRPALLVLALGAAAIIAWHAQALWQDDLSSLSPISAEDQQLDRDLRHDIGAPDVRYIVIASAAGVEPALEASEKAAAILDMQISAGALKGYDSPSRYLPSAAMQRQRQAALPDGETLAASLSTALQGLPFRPESFSPFLDDVATAKVAPLLTRSALDKTALALKVDSLLVERPNRSVAILPLQDVADPDRLVAAFRAVGAGTELLDLKAESDRLLHGYRQEALLLASLGSVAIALLLLAHFRSLRQTAIVLSPLGLAVLATVAFILGQGQKLSIFNLFGLLLVVAVGSNYCLFFQRRGLIGGAGERTVTSLLLANLCTVIGFGVLSLSRMPVLVGIGGTVAIGTACSLVAAAIMTGGLDQPGPSE